MRLLFARNDYEYVQVAIIIILELLYFHFTLPFHIVFTHILFGIFHVFTLSLIARQKTSAKEIETSFGGNICRCTGYRPILDAFQSFSNSIPSTLRATLDIEVI